MKEFEDGSTIFSTPRVRREGGGRKDVFVKYENLERCMDEILEDTLAGDPMNPDVVWTHLSAKDICNKLKELNINVSDNTVRRIIKKTIGKKKDAKTIGDRQVHQ